MSLVEHARRELELAGFFDPTGDYGDMIGKDVLALVELFASQGHSGASAGLALRVFSLVAGYKPLTPLTDNKDEWRDVSEYSGEVAGTMFQSMRRPDAFSKDGGKTYYLLDEPNEFIASLPTPQR